MEDLDLEEFKEICEMVGHEWFPLGGALLQCSRCGASKWMDWAESHYDESDSAS